MVERGLIIVAVLTMLFVVAWVVRWISRQRRRGLEGQSLPDGLRAKFPPGNAGILYFFGPHCGSCRRQATILDRLARDGEVSIARVDASKDDELARRFAVMTVPTTIIIDSDSRVRAINPGLQTEERLVAQLQELSA